MFTYTKEVIINSYTGEDGMPKVQSPDTAAPYTAPTDVLRILRVGEYKATGIQNATIYKTEGNVGQSATLDFVADTLISDVGIHRLIINIGMTGQYLSDFANAGWYPFGKPLVTEFNVTSDMLSGTGSALLLANTVADAIKLTIPYNNVFAKVTVNTVTVVTPPSTTYHVVVTLTNPYAFFDGIRLDSVDGDDYTILASSDDVALPFIITANVAPFATGQWLQENLRFPSYPNLRYAALYSDEYPVPGAVYTQYSFAYEVDREGYFGMAGVGEKMQAVTRHIFYVLNSLVAAFEVDLAAAFPDATLEDLT